MSASTHELKSWVGLFEPILKGDKTHDLRVMDRDFKVGDICLLREYEPVVKAYTGRTCLIEITYITSSRHQECAFSPFALHSATAILSIKRVDDTPTLESSSSAQTCGCDYTDHCPLHPKGSYQS